MNCPLKRVTRGVGAEVGSRGKSKQRVGAGRRKRGWEQIVGAGDGPRNQSRGWEHGMETLGLRKECEQRVRAEYGYRGWEQGVGRSKVWQRLGIAGGRGAGTWGRARIVGSQGGKIWLESWGGNRRAGG
jgi:hypothetical protein